MLKVQGLYAIIDTSSVKDDQLINSAKNIIIGGCRWLQYRDKSDDEIKRFAQAKALKNLCDTYNAHLLINDDVELAKKVSATGVHLGQQDGPVEAARKILGSEAIIGVTCHDSIEFAAKAASDGANYLAFGRFFPSATKPDAPPAKLDILRKAQEFSLPIVAIGGITLENAGQLLDEDVSAIAICNDLLAAPDIRAQAEAYSRLFSHQKNG